MPLVAAGVADTEGVEPGNPNELLESEVARGLIFAVAELSEKDCNLPPTPAR